MDRASSTFARIGIGDGAGAPLRADAAGLRSGIVPIGLGDVIDPPFASRGDAVRSGPASFDVDASGDAVVDVGDAVAPPFESPA